MGLLRTRLLLVVLLALAPAVRAQDGEAPYLDVSIAVFAQNLPADPLERERQGIHAEVRQAESRYLPAYLKALLMESGRWGAVRLVPENDPGAELMIQGSILHSDGARLELALNARDSSGRVWLDGVYKAQAQDSVSLLNPGREPDPFDALHQEVAAALEAVLAQLPPGEVVRLKELAFLRWAASLLPETYAQYVEESEGRYAFSRLPARDDPMRDRLEEIRAHEYLFIDVVDEQYERFAAGIRPVYDLWRKYRREQMAEAAGFTQRQMDSGTRFPAGSYRALRESYDNYRWAKMQQQYLEELAAGFRNEIAPTQIDLEDRLYQLTGTADQQYREWKEILRELLTLEAGE